MDFALVSGKLVAEKFSCGRGGDDYHKQDLYFMKYLSHKFSSAVLMFAAALLACIVLYHTAPSLQGYSDAFTVSPAKSNVSSSSVSN